MNLSAKYFIAIGIAVGAVLLFILSGSDDTSGVRAFLRELLRALF